MTTSGSVSKGVFVFKGKNSVAKAEDYFCDGSAGDQDLSRLGVSEQMWETISQKIQVLQSDLNTKIFEDLLRYVGSSHASFVPSGGGSHAHIVREIPTAALVTGVNMPDHAVMFGNLTTLLQEQVTPHIVELRAKDCPNVRTTMSNMVSQLLQNAQLADDDDEDQVNTRRISSTMPIVVSWYQEVCKRPHGSPKKRRRSEEGEPQGKYTPIVVVLEDLEAFPANVLQDFVTICSNYLRELPLVFIFGIATAVTAVHRLMPHAVSSLLSMEKFQAPPSTEYLTQVIDQVVLTNDIQFKLGPKVFSLLLDLFLFHDFSVLNFIRALQFCLLDHFYVHPFSLLCQPLDDAVQELRNMSHDQVEHIRRLMSFRKHVDSCKPEEQIALLMNDKHTKKVIGKMLEELDQYHECYFPTMRCLHMMMGRLPGYPLGKHLREMYATNLSLNICETAEYRDAIQLLKTLSRDEMVVMLTHCQILLHDESLPSELQEVRRSIEEYYDRFQNIEELAKVHSDGTDEEEEGKAENLPKKMDMYALRQQLLTKKKKKLTVYEVLRNETIELMDKAFRRFLVSPSTLPLHEVMYYNDVGVVRRHINGSPRATIQSALSKPANYIPNKGCVCEDDNIPPTLPDICVIFKLHLECGRLINLYDWLQAYMTVVHSGDENVDMKKPDKVVQARFIRGVSELQFLGFVKPTKRKTDHVARLTWGGC